MVNKNNKDFHTDFEGVIKERHSVYENSMGSNTGTTHRLVIEVGHLGAFVITAPINFFGDVDVGDKIRLTLNAVEI